MRGPDLYESGTVGDTRAKQKAETLPGKAGLSWADVGTVWDCRSKVDD